MEQLSIHVSFSIKSIAPQAMVFGTEMKISECIDQIKKKYNFPEGNSYSIQLETSEGYIKLHDNYTIKEEGVENEMCFLVNEDETEVDSNDLKPRIRRPRKSNSMLSLKRLIDRNTYSSELNLSAYDSISEGLSFTNEDDSNENEEEDFEVPNILTNKRKTRRGHGYKLLTFSGFGKNGKYAIYYSDDSFDEIVSTAINILDMPKNDRYFLMIKYNDQETIWLSEQPKQDYFSFDDNTLIYLFKRDIPIIITSKYAPEKRLTLDISQTISNLTKCVCKDFGIQSHYTFALSLRNTKTSVLNLNPELPLYQQTQTIAPFYFHRKYYLFCYEDFLTLDTTRMAYQDALNAFLLIKYPIKPKYIYKLLVDIVIANSDDMTKFIYPDVDKMLPISMKTTKDERNLIQCQLKQILNENQDTLPKSQFEAMYNFIKVVRKIQGFATTSFYNVLIKTDVQNRKGSCMANVDVSPFAILIYNIETGILEERVSFTSIIDISSMRNKIQLFFGCDQENGYAEYIFQSNEAENMFTLINGYFETLKKMQEDRLEKSICNHGKTPSIIKDKEIILYATTKLDDISPPSFPFLAGFTGSILLAYLINQLHVTRKNNYVVLLKLLPNKFRYIKSNEILGLCNAQKGMVIYLIPNYARITVSLLNGQKQTIDVDITKTIEELTPKIFESFKLPFLYGYTLYHFNEFNEQIPLDIRYTIPEQVSAFNNFIFKRRYYIFYFIQIKDNSIVEQTMLDCNNLVLNSNIFKVPNNIAIDLAYYYLCAINLTTSYRNTFKGPDLAKLFPKNFKITKKFEMSFYNKIKSAQFLEKYEACRKYIRKARKIPGFGYEHFKASLSVINKETNSIMSKIPCVIFSVGTTNIRITENKVPIYKIDYRCILSLKILGKRINIYFIQNEIESQIELEFRNALLPYLAIYSYRKAFESLLIKKQNDDSDEKDEISKRLKGGFVDKNDITYQRMIDLRVTTNPSQLKKYKLIWVELIKKGKELIEILEGKLSLQKGKEYSLLLYSLNSYYTWINPKERLGTKKPIRDSYLFVLEKNQEITFEYGGESRKIIITIIKPVIDIIVDISKEFNITNFYGYTLYYNNTPLSLNLSIPEQIPVYNKLNLKRSFFMCSKQCFNDYTTISKLYQEVSNIFLFNDLDFTIDEVSKLVYYSLIIYDDKIENSIRYMPISPRKYIDEIKQKIKLIIDNNNNENNDKKELMMKYINLVRSHYLFDITQFEIQINNSEEKSLLNIGSYKMDIIIDNDDSFTISYDKIIKMVKSGKQLLISYVFQSEYKEACILSNEIKKIYDIISSHKIVYSMLKENNELEEIGLQSTCYTYNIKTNICFSFNKNPFNKIEGNKNTVLTEKIICLTSEMNLNDIIQKIISEFNLPFENEYSCFLHNSDTEAILITNEKLGFYHPSESSTLNIYKKYTPIIVKTIDGIRKKISINIEKKVHELIEDIANQTYINYYLGYNLFDSETLVPLSYMKSIPEQMKTIPDFIFKNCYFIFHKDDLTNKMILKQIFNDIYDYIKNGNIRINDTEAIELSIYDIFAKAFSPENAKMFIVPEDISNLLPKSYNSKPNSREKLIKALDSSPSFSREVAYKKYITTAKNIEHFGCTIFKAKILSSTFNEVILMKKVKYKIAVSINEDGISLYEPKSKTEMLHLSFSDIIEYSVIFDVINIIYSKDNHITNCLQFTIKDTNTLSFINLLSTYNEVLTNGLIEREAINSFKYTSTFSYLNSNEMMNPYYNFFTSRFLDYPSPVLFQYGKCFSFEYLQLMAMYNLGFFQNNNYILFSSSNGNDRKYIIFDKEKSLSDLNIEDYNYLYVIPKKVNIKFFINKTTIEKRIDIKTKVDEICSTLCSYFKLGPGNCFTLYERIGSKLKPIDSNSSIYETSTSYFELYLKRRFFIFNSSELDNEYTLNSLFYDAFKMYQSGQLVANIEEQLKLLLFSIYSFLEPNEAEESINNPNIISFLKESENLNKNETYDKFLSISKLFTKLDQKTAKWKFVVLSSTLQGFGCEYYNIKYLNTRSQYSSKYQSALCIFSPFKMIICSTESEKHTFEEIFWVNVKSCEREGENISVSYLSIDVDKNDFCIYSEQESKEIFYYIQKMKELASMQEYINFPDFYDPELNQIEVNQSFTIEQSHDQFYEPSYLSTINEITDFSSHEFDIGNFDVNFSFETFNLPEDQNKFIPDISRSLLRNWRKREDGLFKIRERIFLDNFISHLSKTIKNPSEFDQNGIYQYYCYCCQQIQNYVDNDEHVKGKMQSILEPLTLYCSVPDNEKSKKDKYINEIKARAEEAKVEIQKIMKDNDDDNLDYDYEKEKKILGITNALTGISDLFEFLNSNIEIVFPTIYPNVPKIASFLRRIQLESSKITSMVNSMRISTIYPYIIKQRVDIIINDCNKILDKLEEILNNIEDKNLSKISDAYTELNSLIETLSSSTSVLLANVEQKVVDVFTIDFNALSIFIENLTVFINKSYSENQKLSSALRELTETYYSLSDDKYSESFKMQISISLRKIELLLTELDEKSMVNETKIQKLLLSTINISESNISMVIDGFKYLVNLRGSAEVLQNEIEHISLTINNLKIFLPLLENNPVNSQAKVGLQNEFLNIWKLLPSIEEGLKKLNESNFDLSIPMLIEYLKYILQNVLCEKDLIGNISEFTHIIKYQKLQCDIGRILNILDDLILNNEVIRINIDIDDKLRSFYNNFKQIYNQQVSTRQNAHITPFSFIVIQKMKDEVEKTLMLINEAKLFLPEIIEKVPNFLPLENIIEELSNDCKNAIEPLDNQLQKSYRIPPDMKTIKSVIDLLQEIINITNNKELQNLKIDLEKAKIPNEKLLNILDKTKLILDELLVSNNQNQKLKCFINKFFEIVKFDLMVPSTNLLHYYVYLLLDGMIDNNPNINLVNIMPMQHSDEFYENDLELLLKLQTEINNEEIFSFIGSIIKIMSNIIVPNITELDYFASFTYEMNLKDMISSYKEQVKKVDVYLSKMVNSSLLNLMPQTYQFINMINSSLQILSKDDFDELSTKTYLTKIFNQFLEILSLLKKSMKIIYSITSSKNTLISIETITANTNILIAKLNNQQIAKSSKLFITFISNKMESIKSELNKLGQLNPDFTNQIQTYCYLINNINDDYSKIQSLYNSLYDLTLIFIENFDQKDMTNILDVYDFCIQYATNVKKVIYFYPKSIYFIFNIKPIKKIIEQITIYKQNTNIFNDVNNILSQFNIDFDLQDKMENVPIAILLVFPYINDYKLKIECWNSLVQRNIFIVKQYLSQIIISLNEIYNKTKIDPNLFKENEIYKISKLMKIINNSSFNELLQLTSIDSIVFLYHTYHKINIMLRSLLLSSSSNINSIENNVERFQIWLHQNDTIFTRYFIDLFGNTIQIAEHTLLDAKIYTFNKYIRDTVNFLFSFEYLTMNYLIELSDKYTFFIDYVFLEISKLDNTKDIKNIKECKDILDEIYQIFDLIKTPFAFPIEDKYDLLSTISLLLKENSPNAKFDISYLYELLPNYYHNKDINKFNEIQKLVKEDRIEDANLILKDIISFSIMNIIKENKIESFFNIYPYYEILKDENLKKLISLINSHSKNIINMLMKKDTSCLLENDTNEQDMSLSFEENQITAWKKLNQFSTILNNNTHTEIFNINTFINDIRNEFQKFSISYYINNIKNLQLFDNKNQFLSKQNKISIDIDKLNSIIYNFPDRYDNYVLDSNIIFSLYYALSIYEMNIPFIKFENIEIDFNQEIKQDLISLTKTENILLTEYSILNLIMILLTVQQQLIFVNPNTLKYINTNKEFQFDSLEKQKGYISIVEQMKLTKSPILLLSYQKQLIFEEIILQIFIIQDALITLKNIDISIIEGLNSFEIFEYLFKQQKTINNESINILNIDIFQFSYDIVNTIIFIEKLILLNNSYTAIIHDETLEKTEKIDFDKELLKKELSLIDNPKKLHEMLITIDKSIMKQQKLLILSLISATIKKQIKFPNIMESIKSSLNYLKDKSEIIIKNKMISFSLLNSSEESIVITNLQKSMFLLEKYRRYKIINKYFKDTNINIEQENDIYTDKALSFFAKFIKLSDNVSIINFLNKINEEDKQKLLKLLTLDLNNSYIENKMSLFDIASLNMREKNITSNEINNLVLVPNFDKSINDIKVAKISTKILYNLYKLLLIHIKENGYNLNIEMFNQKIQEELYKSILNQMSNIDGLSKIEQILSDLSSNEINQQNYLIIKMIKNINSDLFIKYIMEEFNENNKNETDDLDIKLISRLLSISNNEQIFDKITFNEIIQSIEQLQTHHQRLVICQNLLSFMRDIDKLVDIQSFAESDEGKKSLITQFTQEEIVKHHEYIKTFIFICNKDCFIKFIKRKNKNINIRLFIILNELLNIIKPLNYMFIPNEINQLSLKSEKLKNINMYLYTLKVPSKNKVLNNIKEIYTQIRTLSSEIDLLSENESFDLMKKLNSNLLYLVKKLYRTSTQYYHSEVDIIVKIIPRYILSLTRVFQKLPQNVQELFSIQPIDLVRYVGLIQINLSLIKNKKNEIEYRESICNLLEYLLKIEAATVEFGHGKSLKCYSELLQGIDNYDIAEINFGFINFEALKVRAVAFNITGSYVEYIKEHMKQLQEIIRQAYTSRSRISDKLKTQLISLREKFVDLAKVYSTSKIASISSFTTVESKVIELHEVHKHLKHIEQKFISALINNENKDELFKEIISLITYTQVLSSLGIITKKSNSEILNQFLLSFCRAMKSIPQLLNLLLNPFSPSINVKYVFQFYYEMIDRNILFLSINNADEDNEKIEEIKHNFYFSIISTFNYFLSIINCRTICLTVEHLDLLVAPYLQGLNNSIEEFNKICCSILQLNIGEKFESKIESMNLTFSNFQNLLKKTQKYSISTILAYFSQIIESFNELLISFDEFHNYVPFIPDYRTGNKLPRQFRLPQVHSNQNDDIDIKEFGLNLLKKIKSNEQKQTEFFTKLFDSKTSNNEICENMINSMSSIREILVQVLTFSSKLTSVEQSNKLNSIVSIIVKSYSNLLKEIRYKFIKTNKWSQDVPKIIQSIQEGIDDCSKIIKLSINSSQIYIKKSKDDLMKILDLEANIIKSKKVIEYSSKALSEVELEK